MGSLSAIDRFGHQLEMVLVAGVLLLVIGVYVGMKDLLEDLSSLEGKDITTQDVIKEGRLVVVLWQSWR